jgi:UDP-N-acetylmuramyl pentapeptide phosphotransferase/UDP-N-acetylglucosamine-1-phosphate transferase
MDYIIVVFFSIFLNLAFKKLFLERGLIDNINHRSSHNSVALRSGGTIIFIIIVSYSGYLYFLGKQPYDFSFLLPLSILYVIGLYDDLKGLDFTLKFIFQIIAAKLLIDIGYVIDIFSIFGYEYTFTRIISQLISIILFVSIFNAYNFIDGIDANIHLETIKNITLLLLLFNFSPELHKLSIFCILVVSINLIFNVNKRIKIFTGDSGSLIIPVILLMLVFEGIKFNSDQNSIKYIFILLFYPLFDLIRVVIIRIRSRKSPFMPDKNHLHHRVIKIFGGHVKSSIFILFTVTLIQAILVYLSQIKVT